MKGEGEREGTKGTPKILPGLTLLVYTSRNHSIWDQYPTFRTEG